MASPSDPNLSDLESRDRELLEAARTAAGAAHNPYSGLAVGAALLSADGELATGCNVENASYGLTICGERVAVFKAVSEGHARPVAVAVWASAGRLLSPCGACRQVLHEFGAEMRVTFGFTDSDGELRGRTMLLRELLPEGFVSFGPGDVGGEK